MIQAMEAREWRRNREPIAKLLFPPVRVRFAVALLLTFFPYGFLYPLNYPAGELLTLISWVWVFPSTAGCLALGLLPIVPNESYGYFAFNLFCLATTLGTAHSATRSRIFRRETIIYSFRFARVCMILTLGLCTLQVVTGPELWISVFPNMSMGDGGRGAGLRTEPSLLAGPLILYLSLLICRIAVLHSVNIRSKARRSLEREGVWVILSILVLTRSLSVLIVVICFLPALLKGRKNLLVPVLAAGSGLIVAVIVFGGRIREALVSAGGDVADLATVSLGSWRNIPDLIIVSNFHDYLLPGNPANVRTKINDLAAAMSPLLAWLENTYSTFAAGATTIGLVASGIIFAGGLVAGLKLLSKSAFVRLTWVMLYLFNLFLSAKFEAAGWVALGLIPLVTSWSGSKAQKLSTPR